MGEKRDDEQAISTAINQSGLSGLPNELKHQIIVHAVDDPDAWKANETVGAVMRTNRHFQALAGSKALEKYKNNLYGGRLVSDLVVEAAFKDRDFSVPFRWGQRHIGHEVEAVMNVLEFQSPQVRSEIFKKISEKGLADRMLAYSYIAERAELFQEHEIGLMERDALATFRNHDVPWDLAPYYAAEVLVQRHDYRSLEDCINLDRASLNQIENVSAAIVNRKPSLLKDARTRAFICKNFPILADPYEALAQLAAYADRSSQDEVDFIIEKSLRCLGEENVRDDEERRREAPARAIATLSGANIREEHKDELAQLVQSGSEQGRALAAAFKEIAQDQLSEPPVNLGLGASGRLVRKLVRSQDAGDDISSIVSVIEVAESARKQMNAARQALMNSVRDRNNRGR